MKLSLITHFHNEEMLLPHFIDHHKDIFDDAVMINHASTDRSLEIIKAKAPASWKVVDTQLPDFNAWANDLEVMEWEKTLPGWKMALNITEWIWHPNFREYVARHERGFPGFDAVGLKSVVLVDTPGAPPVSDNPLWLDRHHGYIDLSGAARRWRFLHRGDHGHYEIGRHGTQLAHHHDAEAYILWWGFAPWPECMERKLQIQTRIPQSDKNAGFGFQHIQTEESLTAEWNVQLGLSRELLDDPLFAESYNAFLQKLAPVAN